MPTAKPVAKRSGINRLTKRRAPPRVQPGTGDFMSVEEFWRNHMPEKPRNQLYQLVGSGIFPFVRSGRRIDLLRKPTLEILAGERPPGPLPGATPPKKTRRAAGIGHNGGHDQPPKLKRRVPHKRKLRPTAKKREAAPPAVAS